MRIKAIAVILILTCFVSSCTFKHNNKLDKEINNLASNSIVHSLNNADILLEGDSIIYNISGNYTVNISGKAIDLPENIKNIRTNQIFLSQDFGKLYYNTDFANNLGRLYVYDINSKKQYDLLDSLEISIDGYISTFSYRDDRIIAILGKVLKSKENETQEKRDTNLMLDIDLTNNSHTITELPFTPQGISTYNGLCFIGENILMCQSEYLCNEKETQCIIEVDKKGKLINKYDLHEEQGIYNIQASPNNKKISYQIGQTSVDLYVYDIDKNNKLQIFSSNTKDNFSYCFYSTWSKKGDYIYYITQDSHNKGNLTTQSYTLHTHKCQAPNIRTFNYIEDEDIIEKYINKMKILNNGWVGLL